MVSIRDKRLLRIAQLDILPVKPYQGWTDIQMDEALRRPELFRGNVELYASVRKEAIKRGLGGEEDFPPPFSLTDTREDLPFLLKEDRSGEKHKRKERKERLKKVLKEMTKKSSLDRLLQLASVIQDDGFNRQVDLYIERNIERQAHMVPSKETNTPPMWKHNMDYDPEEGSPYFGSSSEFLERFPGGVEEWRKWREKTREQRERRHRIASLMPEIQEDTGLDTFLKEAWAQETGMETQAHFVPEGGDDVEKLGDEEPKIWSDDPKWKSIGEFLKAHREHFGQEADDAALRAAKDFVRYWKLTTKKHKGAK